MAELASVRATRERVWRAVKRAVGWRPGEATTRDVWRAFQEISAEDGVRLTSNRAMRYHLGTLQRRGVLRLDRLYLGRAGLQMRVTPTPHAMADLAMQGFFAERPSQGGGAA